MSFSFMTFVAMLSGSIAICSLVLLISLYRYPLSNSHKPGIKSAGSNYSILTRSCWPFIVAMSVVVLPLMTWGLRQRLTQAIKQAGLSGWSCSQFLAMQLIAGLGITGFILLLFALTDIPISVNHLFFLLILAIVTSVLPRLWLRTQRQQRYREIERGLPFFLDIVSVGLEAGMNLQSAVQLALDHLQFGPLKDAWQQTMFEIRSGIPRTEAFHRMSQRIEMTCIRQMMNAFIQGETMGLSLGKTISEFSRQLDQYQLLRSEKLALQAPIKMLFPLAFCIFPCTFLVLGFPVLAQLLGLE